MFSKRLRNSFFSQQDNNRNSLNFSNNNNEDKPIISIGQALLILINHHKDNNDVVEELKRLYLSGNTDNAALEKINNWMNDPLLIHFNVSRNPDVINEDPSRRYFETHLAYHTFVNTIKKIRMEDLENHFGILCRMEENIFQNLETMYKQAKDKMTTDERSAKIVELIESQIIPGRKEIYQTVNGEDIGELKKNDFMWLEFTDLIRQLGSEKSYHGLSRDDQDKLLLMTKAFAFCWFIQNFYSLFVSFPMNLYNKDVFSKEWRGREERFDQNNESQLFVQSANMGIMKSYMPSPVDDVAFNSDPFSYLRGPDRSRSINDALWPEMNFEALVHPFVCSISGTILLKLRTFLFLNNNNALIFGDYDKFSNYIKCFVSFMSYHIGGHSLHEFLTPLSLSAVKPNFAFIQGFDQLSKENLLLNGNEEAFNAALYAAIRYNDHILKRRSINQSIITTKPNIKTQNQLEIHFQQYLAERMGHFVGLCRERKIPTGIELDLKEAFQKHLIQIHKELSSSEDRDVQSFITSDYQNYTSYLHATHTELLDIEKMVRYKNKRPNRFFAEKESSSSASMNEEENIISHEVETTPEDNQKDCYEIKRTKSDSLTSS